MNGGGGHSDGNSDDYMKNDQVVCWETSQATPWTAANWRNSISGARRERSPAENSFHYHSFRSRLLCIIITIKCLLSLVGSWQIFGHPNYPVVLECKANYHEIPTLYIPNNNCCGCCFIDVDIKVPSHLHSISSAAATRTFPHVARRLCKRKV